MPLRPASCKRPLHSPYDIVSENTADPRIFAEVADCLRSLSQYRTNSAHDFPTGPTSESMAVKLLDLAKKLEKAEGAAMSRKISSSDRALLMEALSALAPLLDHPQTVDVAPLEGIERKRCTENIQIAIERLGGTGA
jgi:hypothetical protein